MRGVVTQRLRNFFRDELLVQDRFMELPRPRAVGKAPLLLRTAGRGSGSTVSALDVALESSLVQALWIYAHRSGDVALIRERWPLLRRL